MKMNQLNGPADGQHPAAWSRVSSAFSLTDQSERSATDGPPWGQAQLVRHRYQRNQRQSVSSRFRKLNSHFCAFSPPLDSYSKISNPEFRWTVTCLRTSRCFFVFFAPSSFLVYLWIISKPAGEGRNLKSEELLEQNKKKSNQIKQVAHLAAAVQSVLIIFCHDNKLPSEERGDVRCAGSPQHQTPEQRTGKTRHYAHFITATSLND